MILWQPVPRTRVRVGRALGRGTTWRAHPRGLVAYKEQLPSGRWRTWEEWHLRDDQGLDHRLAYDYDTRVVTLSRPEQVTGPPDPRTLRPGAEVTLTLDGRAQRLRVVQAGSASVFHVVGSPAHPLRAGEEVAHAELHGPDVVLTVQGPGPVPDVHRRTVLDADAQKDVLGRVVTPRTNRFLLLGFWFAISVLVYNLLHACGPADATSGATATVLVAAATASPAWTAQG